jgi:predicted DNA-binding antitoxin AbrB/MazE fold protein
MTIKSPGINTMTVPVRAVYENGHLRLLDPVDLQEGQQVSVNIAPVDEQPVRRKRIPNLFPGIVVSDDFDAELPDSFWLGEDE